MGGGWRQALLNRSIAFAVKDNKIMQIHNDIARENGILLCSEDAATATYQLAMKQGLVIGDGNAILFNLATAAEISMPPVAGTLDNDRLND